MKRIPMYGDPRPAPLTGVGMPDHMAGPLCLEGRCDNCDTGSTPVVPAYCPVSFLEAPDG